MNARDTIPPMHNRVILDIYEGDVMREPLTREQRRLNRLWMREGVRFLGNGKEIRGVPGQGECLLPIFAGQILSRPVDRMEYDNLVVTTGKQLMLDRLFALAAAGALTAMGVGASATAAGVGNTQLNTTPDLRLFDALPIRTGLVVAAIRTYATGEGNINWQEIALFNGVVNGTSTMFNRIAPIGAFNKTSAVSIVAEVDITQA